MCIEVNETDTERGVTGKTCACVSVIMCIDITLCLHL